MLVILNNVLIMIKCVVNIIINLCFDIYMLSINFFFYVNGFERNLICKLK